MILMTIATGMFALTLKMAQAKTLYPNICKAWESSNFGGSLFYDPGR